MTVHFLPTTGGVMFEELLPPPQEAVSTNAIRSARIGASLKIKGIMKVSYRAKCLHSGQFDLTRLEMEVLLPCRSETGAGKGVTNTRKSDGNPIALSLLTVKHQLPP
jgi:hypothetical protein